MRVKYTPNPRLYEEYYKQIGHGFPVYIGSMRGSGVGSVLSGLFRAAIPLLKKGEELFYLRDYLPDYKLHKTL